MVMPIVIEQLIDASSVVSKLNIKRSCVAKIKNSLIIRLAHWNSGQYFYKTTLKFGKKSSI